MTTVITYGTYDLLHHGHVRLLERARALGDFLIVGVTATDFDKTRGKINVRQSLMERVEAVKATGLADEVIVEEYEGQKIDDISRYGVDIFTVGSDWEGHFDYLSEFCQVIYLDRTQGISSTEVRAQQGKLRMGFIGESHLIPKHIEELTTVNGIEARALWTEKNEMRSWAEQRSISVPESYSSMLTMVDAVYIACHPTQRSQVVREALEAGTHVLCESPIALSVDEFDALHELADRRGLVLLDALKTAYATAYHRLKLLVKSGRIGSVISIQATCTSLRELTAEEVSREPSSFCAWAPFGLLPIFHLLGTDFDSKRISSRIVQGSSNFDAFSKIDLAYPESVATVIVGKGLKAEGELIIAGTKGYIIVPAPWWKTDYFEIRFENPTENQRYFYQLNGEGIRDQFIQFQRSIEHGTRNIYLTQDISRAVVGLVEAFEKGDRSDLTPMSVSDSQSLSRS